MTTCPSCHCHQPHSLLCSECTGAVETMLAAVPTLAAELDTAIARQARIAGGGKTGQGHAHELSPVNWGAVAARDALLVEAAMWGGDIDAVRRNPQAAEIVTSIGRVVKEAYRAIDRMRDRQYLGQCQHHHDGQVCSAELWVKPGDHQAACRQCRTVHDVPARRADLLARAEDMIVTPREAAGYVGQIGGIPVGHQRIRNYLDRGHIPTRPSHDGTARLRFGDLLDLLRKEAARHDAHAV